MQDGFQSWLNHLFARKMNDEDRRFYVKQLNELFSTIVQAHFGPFADEVSKQPEFAYNTAAKERAKQTVLDNTLDILKLRIVALVVSPSQDAAQTVIDYYLTTKTQQLPSFSALIAILKAAFTQNHDNPQKKTAFQNMRSAKYVPTEIRSLIKCIASILQEAAINAPTRYYGPTQFDVLAHGTLSTIFKAIHAIQIKYDLQDIRIIAHIRDINLLGYDNASRDLNRKIALAEHRVWLPLKPLVTAPLASQEDLKLYARDRKDVELFANRIGRSDGVILIAGYRGVGKSTFIYEALSMLTEKPKYSNDDHWHIVPISISLAKASGITNILRLCIRKLSDTFLNESEVHVDVVARLTKGVDKLLTNKEQNHLMLAYLRATWKVNMQRDDNVKILKQIGFDAGLSIKIGSLLESTMGSMIAGTLPSFGANGKMSKEWNKAIGSTVALPDYDEDKAEDDIVQFIRMLAIPEKKRDNKRIKLVFIFDEMDKMSEDEQEELIKQLKNLFLERHSVFLLVTSKSFYYRWWDERKIEDAILSSYFSWIKTIQLFTSTETALLLKRLIQIDDTMNQLSKEEGTFVDTLARYLTYRAHGIPRDIIRELQSIQLWLDDSGQTYIDDRIRQYHTVYVYAELQNSLEKLFDYTNTTGSTHSSDVSTSGSPFTTTLDNTFIAEYIWTNEERKEQIKRGLYVIIEELLDQGSLELNPDSEVFKQISKDNLKMVLPHEFKLLLERLAWRLRDIRLKVGPDTPLASFYFDNTSNSERTLFILETAPENGFPTLRVAPQFYNITGRPLNLASITTQLKATPLSQEKIEELLKSDDLQQQRAIGILQGATRPFSPGVYEQLCRLFLTAQNRQTRLSIIGLQDAGFFDTVRRVNGIALNEFVDTETDERLLQEFIRLVRICTEVNKGDTFSDGTSMLLRLLERQIKTREEVISSRLALPESLLIDTISILAILASDDVLPQVLLSLDRQQDIPNTLLVPLRTLESKSKQNLIELLVALDFNAISLDTLQTIVREQDDNTLMNLWDNIFAQKQKKIVQQVLIVLTQQIMRNFKMDAQINKVLAWVNDPIWDDIDQHILHEAQTNSPNLRFQLQSIVADERKERLDVKIDSYQQAPTPIASNDSYTGLLLGGGVLLVIVVGGLILALVFHITILWWIVIGLMLGFLASIVLRGGGYGIIGDIIGGIVGALIGGFLMNLIIPNRTDNFIFSTVTAFIGACILITTLRAFTPHHRRL